LQFKECWDRKVDFDYKGLPVHILSKPDLIMNRRTVGRGQDLLDLEKLEQHSDSSA
jgi:hypothetical protein